MANTTPTTTDVLIVGAGPAGLTLANLLAQSDVRFLLVEKNSAPSDQSRAVIVHTRTLELWDKLDLADRAIANGVKLHGINLLINGKRVASFPLAANEAVPSPFPFALAYPQGKTEQLLMENLNNDAATIAWQTELISLMPNNHGARAVVRRPDGVLEEIDAKYVVGADGARSRVRQLLNVNFPGSTYAPTAFLADVALDPPPETGNLHLNLANGGFVGILALGEGRYRLFGALSPTYAALFQVQDEGRNVALADLRRWFEEYFHLSNRITRADWTSIYRIHQRLADTFRIGSVFLVGDAAHIHSPAGGQGMNLGIGDAFNLGWKLALVLHNEAREEVLDSYDVERRPVAQVVLKGADRAFELEATQNPIMELFRLYVLPRIINVVARIGAMRGAIFQLFSQTWISYRSSPVVAKTQRGQGLKGLQIGDRAPHGVFETGLNKGRSLFSLLRGPDHHVFVFEGQEAGELSTHLVDNTQALLDTYRTTIRTHVIARGNQELHARYRVTKPSIVLVRPDGHIAYAGSAADLALLSKYLDRWYLRKSSVSMQDVRSAETVTRT